MQLTKFYCLAFVCLALSSRGQEQQQSPAASSQPSQSAQATSETRTTRVMTIEEAIKLALRHNLDIQITQYQPQFDQYALNIAFAAWEPAFNFSASHTYDASPGVPTSGTTAGTPPNTSGRENYDANVGGLLPSGLTYSLNGPLTRNTTFGTTNSLTTYSSFPLLSLKQPILKNFWIDNARYQIQLDKRNLKIDELLLRLKIMTVVNQVKAAYFNLIFSRENVKVNTLALQLAEQLQAEDVKKVQVGALAPLDEKQAESQAASSRANLLQAEQALSVQENVLKNLLSDNFSEWATVTPIPSEQLVAVPEELNLQESWRRGVEQRPELLEARLTVEKQNITIK
ncbi:MAG TPA: TolC family protein, partial [Verrucomicrobiae bacterium]|nr:TolC family protein [Verrucomicrobiae bacterium]